MLRGRPQLAELSVFGLSLPSSELPHLYALRRLRSLCLYDYSSSRVSDAALARFVPPTPRLPALTDLLYHHDVGGLCLTLVSVKRRGASFEWMQQRLTR